MIIVSIIFSLGQYIASKLVRLMLDHQVGLIAIMGIAEGNNEILNYNFNAVKIKAYLS